MIGLLSKIKTWAKRLISRESYTPRYVRPNRRSGNRLFTTLSCWDCEFIRVAGFPARMCVIYPEQAICSSDPKGERELSGRVVAEECPCFRLADELDLNLPALETIPCEIKVHSRK